MVSKQHHPAPNWGAMPKPALTWPFDQPDWGNYQNLKTRKMIISSRISSLIADPRGATAGAQRKARGHNLAAIRAVLL